jgi:hypothetical protein
VLALLVSLACSLLRSLQRSWCADLSLTFAYTSGSSFLQGSISIGILTSDGILDVISVVQMSVLGPRLILSVREYHAKLVAGESDAETSMNSIVFQEHVNISTSGTV